RHGGCARSRNAAAAGAHADLVPRSCAPCRTLRAHEGRGSRGVMRGAGGGSERSGGARGGDPHLSRAGRPLDPIGEAQRTGTFHARVRVRQRSCECANVMRRIERWIFSGGSAERLAAVRIGLCTVLALRLTRTVYV